MEPLLIDEDRIFELNKNIQIEKKSVLLDDDHKLEFIKIPNFYKHPEKVRDLFLRSPHCLGGFDYDDLASNFWTAEFKADMRHVYEKFGEVLKELDSKYNIDEVSLENEYKVARDQYIKGCPEEHAQNVFNKLMNKFKRIDPMFMRPNYLRLPSSNHKLFHGLVCLSDHENSKNSIGFYQHMETGVNRFSQLYEEVLKCSNSESYTNFLAKFDVWQPHTVNNDRWWNKESVRKKYKSKNSPLLGDKNHGWISQHIETIEFNTMIVYDADYYHSLYLKKGMFEDGYMLNQLLTLPKIEKEVIKVEKVEHDLRHALLPMHIQKEIHAFFGKGLDDKNSSILKKSVRANYKEEEDEFDEW